MCSTEGYDSVPFNVMEQIKIFVSWTFQLSFCICVHNLLFPTIFKWWWYETSVTIPVSTFAIDFVFENCFLSAMTPYMGGAYPYMDLNAKYGKLLLRCLQLTFLRENSEKNGVWERKMWQLWKDIRFKGEMLWQKEL